MRGLLVLCLIMAVTSLGAEPPMIGEPPIKAIEITDLPDGWYAFQIVDGEPSATYSMTLYTTRPEPSPNPTPSPPPVLKYAVLKSVVKKAMDNIVDSNKPKTQTALATLYRTVAGLPATTSEQYTTAVDTVFAALSLPAVWTHPNGWKATVDKELKAFTTAADMKGALLAIAQVLEGQ